MSWSITIENLKDYKGFDAAVYERLVSQHPGYALDMNLALELARKAGFESANLSGCRTPNPYGTNEVTDISVRGMTTAKDYTAEILKSIGKGADE